MTSSGVRDVDSTDKRTKKAILDREEDLINSYKTWDEASSLSSLAGGGTQSSGEGSAPGNFMPLSGDNWLGQYGNQFEIIFIQNGEINASRQSGASSPMLVLNSESGPDDFLDTILPGGDVLFYQEQLIQTVGDPITIRPKLEKNIVSISGDGATNIITVEVADTSQLTDGDTVKIIGTLNYDLDDAVITILNSTEFEYDLGSVGSATIETIGLVERGNIETIDGNDLVCPENTIVHFIFDTITQLYKIDSATIPTGSGGGGAFLPIAGGTMLGPIGYDPDLVAVDSDGRVQITSSYMQSLGLSPPTDVFFFDGALFDGQQLKYQVVNQNTQIIKNAVLKSISNIVGNGVDNIITVTIDDTSLLVSGDKVNISATTNFNLDNTIITVTGATTFTYDLGSIGSATPEGSGIVQRGNIVMPDDQDLVLDSTISPLGTAFGNFVFDPSILGTGWRLISSTVGGGGGSPLTTKGDIFGFSTVDARIPVGADALPLVANSSVTLGVGYEILKIAGGGTGQSAYAEGDILFGQSGGNNLGKLTIGGVNTFLNGGTTPSWSTIALNQLSDVNIPSPVATNVLTFNGSLWIAQAAPGGSPLTTKGDIFGFDTADARIGVGSNDLPLVANSSVSLGVNYTILKIAGGGTGLSSVTEGDILFGQSGGNNLGKLAIGGTNTFLRGGTLPNWSTIELNQLSDVTLTSPSAGNVLTFNGSLWINQAPSGGGIVSINSDTTAAQLISGGTNIDVQTSSGTTTISIDGIIGIVNGGTGISSNTRGDIMYAAADDGWTKLPVGSTNQILRNDGTDVFWATLALNNLSDVTLTSPSAGNVLTFNGSLWINQAPSSGDLDGIQDFEIWQEQNTTQFEHDVYMTNSKSGTTADGGTGASLIEDVGWWVPIYIAKRSRIIRMGLEITGGTSTSNVVMGIYSNRTDGQNYPETKVVQGSTFLSNTPSAQTVFLTATNLEAGLYWLVVASTSGDLECVFTLEGESNCVGYQLDTVGTNHFDAILGYTSSQNTTTLPTTAPNNMDIANTVGFGIPMVFAIFNANTS